MPRTEQDRRTAAAEADKAVADFERTAAEEGWAAPTDLRAIVDAMTEVARAETAVRAAVLVARTERQRPWSLIASVLGVSRQAAKQQYGT